MVKNIDLNALTGWIPERVPLNSGTTECDKEALFEKLFQRFHQGKLAESECERAGLVDAHAYAVLNLRKVATSQNKQTRLLLLKNPWTHLRWKGKYSEQDANSWTPELCKLLNYDPNGAKQFDDGVFWIDYESVCHFFDVFYINWNPSIFPFTHTLHSCWDAGQGPTKDVYTIGDNPQYRLKVSNKSDKAAVWILLTRHIMDKDDFADNKEYLSLLVYKSGSQIYLPMEPKPIISGARINSPHYLCQLLAEGRQEYTLVVAQHEKTKNIFYTLKVYSTADFSCTELKSQFKIEKTLSGEWKGNSAGGCGNDDQEAAMNNPLYHLILDDGSDDNNILIDLRGPKQFSVGFDFCLVSSRRPHTFERRNSGNFRCGITVLELKHLPSGTYSIRVMTFTAGQEGPFLLKVASSCGFQIKRGEAKRFWDLLGEILTIDLKCYVKRNCMTTEDWGAVTFDELFDNVGETPSLQALVADVTKIDEFNNADLPTTAVDAKFSSISASDWWTAPNPCNKVMPVNYKPLLSKKTAPKILKKRLLQKDAEEKGLKHVRFKVEELVSNDGVSLVTDRLVSMGAKKRVSKGINYRKLKQERATLREQKKNGAHLLVKVVKKKKRKERR